MCGAFAWADPWQTIDPWSGNTRVLCLITSCAGKLLNIQNMNIYKVLATSSHLQISILLCFQVARSSSLLLTQTVWLTSHRQLSQREAWASYPSCSNRDVYSILSMILILICWPGAQKDFCAQSSKLDVDCGMENLITKSSVQLQLQKNKRRPHILMFFCYFFVRLSHQVACKEVQMPLKEILNKQVGSKT